MIVAWLVVFVVGNLDHCCHCFAANVSCGRDDVEEVTFSGWIDGANACWIGCWKLIQRLSSCGAWHWVIAIGVFVWSVSSASGIGVVVVS